MSSGMTTELLRKSVPKVLFVVAVGVTSQKAECIASTKGIRKRMCETPNGMQNTRSVLGPRLGPGRKIERPPPRARQ